MNLQPVPLEDIPLGKPLPWRLYDRNGYIVFARGEMVSDRQQLEQLLPEGLLKDLDASDQTHETGDFAEFRETAPVGLFPPQGIKPQIGDMLQISLPEQSPPLYATVRLIGYIKNQSIIVSRPAHLVPGEGQLAEVRMVTGCHIYAFQVPIQRICISPVQYLHLGFPLEVRVQRLRKSPWASVYLSATSTDAEGAKELVRILNLSPDGCQLHASPMLGKEGDEIQLSLHVTMDELKSTLNLHCTLMHIESAAVLLESNLREYGIRFNDVQAGDAIWLKALVYRQIAEGVHR